MKSFYWFELNFILLNESDKNIVPETLFNKSFLMTIRYNLTIFAHYFISLLGSLNIFFNLKISYELKTRDNVYICAYGA